MRPKRQITNRPRKPRIPDIWCHSFARFLGRQLTPAEKIVVSALEKQRRNPPRPILIIDPEGHDSTTILDAYLRYRLATSPNGATAIRCTPARQPREKRNPRLRAITYRQIKSIRGTTPAFMLLLDAHQAGSYSPMYKNSGNFRRLCTTLFPILDTSGFLIIHLRTESPPTTLPSGLLIRSTERAQRSDEAPPPRPAGILNFSFFILNSSPPRPAGILHFSFLILNSPFLIFHFPTQAVRRAPQPKAKPHGKRTLTYCDKMRRR